MSDTPTVANTLERLFARAEAAEARCAELEALVRKGDQHEIWQFHVGAGRKSGLMDMRERAAKLINGFATDLADHGEAVYVGDYRYLANMIRALPLDQT